MQIIVSAQHGVQFEAAYLGTDRCILNDGPLMYRVALVLHMPDILADFPLTYVNIPKPKDRVLQFN